MAAKNNNRERILQDLPYDASDVTPTDADLPDGRCRSLWIATTGTLRITTWGGTVVNFTQAEVTAMIAATGGFFLWPCTRVHSTGTTATGIKAVY